MRFKAAVESIPALSTAWKPGLQALRPEDKPHIKPQSTTKLSGSVDIDTAYQQAPAHASANRWDFAIGYQHTNRVDEVIYWVETHTGSDAEIKTMLKKLAWLKAWLRSEGRPLTAFKGEYFWAPSGATSFSKGAKQVKALASLGLLYAGSKGVVIPDNHHEPKTA